MCFSATASFVAAGLTAAVGMYTVSRTSDPREMPLAVMPLLFAAQQFVEGGLWLTLPVSPEGAVSSLLSHAFLVFALIVWPVLSPFAAFSVETTVLRRRMIGLCLAVGVAVAAYFLWTMLVYPHQALIAGGHIRYEVGETPVSVDGAYMVATTLGLLVSSRRAVALLGVIVLTGSIVSYGLYLETFVSVWCFFAAVASVVIASHFRLTAARRAARA
jgi:hypothetical protein